MRSFDSLSPREVLGLAVHMEEGNATRFRTFAAAFRGYDAAVTERFEELATEEDAHAAALTRRFVERYGQEMPQLDQVSVHEVIEAPELDDGEAFLFDSTRPQRVYELALTAEESARAFYRRAAEATADSELAATYCELADAEQDHVQWLLSKLSKSAGSTPRLVSSPDDPNEQIDYLYCTACQIHVPCRRVPTGGWEVQCAGCVGECGVCKCYLRRFCFGSREQFPPFDNDGDPPLLNGRR